MLFKDLTKLIGMSVISSSSFEERTSIKFVGNVHSIKLDAEESTQIIVRLKSLEIKSFEHSPNNVYSLLSELVNSDLNKFQDYKKFILVCNEEIDVLEDRNGL